MAPELESKHAAEVAADEKRLRAAVVRLHGVPMGVIEVTRSVRGLGWDVDHLVVEQILRDEGIRPRRRQVRAGDPVMVRRRR